MEKERTLIQYIDAPVPMRDGVALSADIRIPSGGGRFPTIVTMSPYNNSGFAPLAAVDQTRFLGRGYAEVGLDCRGRFDSGGVFQPFRDADDGHDVMAWVRAQPWCDGRIGMLGSSYSASATLNTAWTRPPGLCAIAATVMGRDLFKDTVYVNGVPALPIAVQWALINSGRSTQSNDTTDWEAVWHHLPLGTIDEAAGYRVPFLREWFAHPVYDDYWARASVERHYANYDVPAFHGGGWYDYWAEGTIQNFCGMRAKGGPGARAGQKLVMGPWGHNYTRGQVVGQLDFGPQAAAVSLDNLAQQWLDRWVRDERNGIDEGAPIRIFVMGANVWRDEHEWPLARTVETPLYLASQGSANTLSGDGALLTTLASGSAETDGYVYDPDDPVPALGGACAPVNGPVDHAAIERRDDVLVYSTEPLTEDIEVTGAVRMALFASSDAPDTDFIARLCDVYPDNRSIIICDGIVRARFREGLDREVLMTPGNVYEFSIGMSVTSNLFRAGHRIRLEVTSSCFPRYARSLNTGEPVMTGVRHRPARQTVHHSRALPSRLILPVIPRA
jgi:putative CocE/NonD family hydrolase